MRAYRQNSIPLSVTDVAMAISELTSTGCTLYTCQIVEHSGTWQKIQYHVIKMFIYYTKLHLQHKHFVRNMFYY